MKCFILRRPALILLITMIATGPASATPLGIRVSTERMQETIEGIAEAGYATGTTTNQARFVADFLLSLANNPEIGQRGRFWIDPQDFLEAWLQATGTERENTPTAIRNVAGLEQRFHVDPSPGRIEVLDTSGHAAKQVLAVCIAWPDEPGRPDRFEYLDRMSDPEVRMRHKRLIRYLLVDTGRYIAYEKIRGVAGQPIDSGLGALFSVLGMARIASTRLAVAEDGTQVNRTRGRKVFGFDTVATIEADGRAQRGVSDQRPDLVALEQMLEEDLQVRFGGNYPAPCD